MSLFRIKQLYILSVLREKKSYEVQTRKSALHFALKGCSCYTHLSMCKQNKSSVRAYQL